MAQKNFANIDQFYFLTSGQDNSELLVQSFEITESISEYMYASVILSSKSADITTDSMVGQSATILICRNQIFYPHTGIITEFHYIETNTDVSVYKAIVVSNLWILTQSNQYRVLQKISIPDIVQEVLKEYSLDKSAQFKVNKSNFPNQEYVAQFNESDYHFINRIMENAGLWFIIKEEPVSFENIENAQFQDTIIITDNPDQFKSLTPDDKIRFNAQSGFETTKKGEVNDVIHKLVIGDHSISSSVTVKNYNYRTPEIELKATKSIDDGATGTIYEYGGLYKNISEATSYASLLSKRESCRREQLYGESVCRGFRASHRITISEHERDDLNSTFVITSVLHTGKMTVVRGIGEKPAYTNCFTAIPDSLANKFAPEKKTAEIVIPGVLNGKVEATGSDYASIDEQGRYKIRMPYDMSETDNYDCSKYVRLGEFYSGAQYGMHFPLHENTEVLVGHINDHPDKPIGIGSIPNGNNTTPVKSSNKADSVFKTAGGNVLSMNDTKGAQQMNISTPYDMSLGCGNNQTTKVSNDRSVSVGKNEKTEISGNKTQTVKGNQDEGTEKDFKEQIGGNHSITIDSKRDETYGKEHSVEVSGNSTSKVSGNHVVDVKVTNSEKVSGSSKTTVGGDSSLSAKGPLTIQVGGDTTIKAPDQIGLDSIMITVQGNTSVKFESGGSSIELSPAEIKINSSVKVMVNGSITNTMGGIIMVSGMPVNIN
jgi:type VI secretion system secreted protein VgrG